MPSSLNIRLGLMMLLNYIIWGSWYVTISTYLTTTLKFTGTQAGAVFGTASVAAVVSPFFVGLVADRFFSTEKVMASLYAIGAILVYAVTHVTSFAAVYGLMLLYCLSYFPTIALTNSLAMQNVKNVGRDFPPIRMMGTLGWILVGVLIGYLKVEASATQFLLAAAASLVMSLFSLTLLPHTPPKAKGEPVNVRNILGLDALQMMKEPSFAVFIVASILACIPLTFYFSFTNNYLNDVGVRNAAGKMTLGQFSELFMMLMMPLIFRWVTVKYILVAGLLSWTVRYALLANGNAGEGMWMFYLAIVLHGVCYDFFFMTGQMYTDQEAPPHLRGTAQGFITLVTYGIGMLLGSFLSGGAVDYFTHTQAGTVTRNWPAFWMSSAGMAFVILLMILVFFRSSEKIRQKAAA
ncbi:MAG: nucleoside permease [Acidobacteriota bacterium]|nr:nucleoside permease [Acidobacteriota bacterium]